MTEDSPARLQILTSTRQIIIAHKLIRTTSNSFSIRLASRSGATSTHSAEHRRTSRRSSSLDSPKDRLQRTISDSRNRREGSASKILTIRTMRRTTTSSPKTIKPFPSNPAPPSTFPISSSESIPPPTPHNTPFCAGFTPLKSPSHPSNHPSFLSPTLLLVKQESPSFESVPLIPFPLPRNRSIDSPTISISPRSCSSPSPIWNRN